jgi:hypothetical protein
MSPKDDYQPLGKDRRSSRWGFLRDRLATIGDWSAFLARRRLRSDYEVYRARWDLRVYKHGLGRHDPELQESFHELSSRIQNTPGFCISLVDGDLNAKWGGHDNSLRYIPALIKTPSCGTQNLKKVLFIAIRVSVPHDGSDGHCLATERPFRAALLRSAHTFGPKLPGTEKIGAAKILRTAKPRTSGQAQQRRREV